MGCNQNTGDLSRDIHTCCYSIASILLIASRAHACILNALNVDYYVIGLVRYRI